MLGQLTALRTSGFGALLVLLAACTGSSADTDVVENAPPGDPPASSSLPTGPPADRDREVQLGAEWNDRYLSCLVDAGIGVTSQPDGGYQIDPGGLSDAAFEDVGRQCQEQAGPYPTPAPITAEEASGLYDLNLEAVECLEGQGVSVREPPSRDQYVDALLESYETNVAPWTPYDGVGSAYEDQCPQPRLEDLS